MTRTDTEAPASGDSRNASEIISIEGVQTYLRCPRRYRYQHEYGLHTGDDDPQAARLELVRTAICDTLRAGDVETLESRARDRFADLWADYGEGVHSRAQRRHERRVLEASIRAYVDEIGTDHAEYLTATRASGVVGELVGPGLPLRSVVTPTRTADAGAGTDEGASDDRHDTSVDAEDVDSSERTDADERRIRIDVPIDYAVLDGSSFVGVRFVPTAAHLGILRYRTEWEGDVADQFSGHFDADRTEFAPEMVGVLFETAAAIDGLRALRARLDLEQARTCRYVQIPLLDRDRLSVNPLRERVETSLEPVDLTDPYLDHHTFGLTHEHRNRTVDDGLRQVATAVVCERGSDDSDPGDDPHFEEHWERIRRETCPSCPYAVCCTAYVSSEVAVDE